MVGAQRLLPARGVMARARAERDALEIGQRSAGQRSADAGEGVLAVERREVARQKADPRGALEIVPGERPRLGVASRGFRGQLEQSAGREADLLGQARRVGRCSQTGHQRRAVAVVLRAAFAVHAQALPARAPAAGAARRRGDTRGPRAAGRARFSLDARQRLRADRATLYEAIVPAEGRHGSGGEGRRPRWRGLSRRRSPDRPSPAGPVSAGAGRSGPHRRRRDRPDPRPLEAPRRGRRRCGVPSGSGRPCARTGGPR